MTTRTIELADVLALGNVDDALADFYSSRVADVAAQTGVSEREIRQWMEDELISEQGFRTQALQGPGAAGAAVVTALENAHLIRTESRRGAQWYELSHDRLVAPVRTANEAWRREHLSMLQVKANEWNQRARPAGLLIAGEVLAEAEEWAASHEGEMLAVDHEYLKAGRANEQQALLLKRSSTRNKTLAVVASALALLAVIGLVFALSANRESERQAATAAEQARLAVLAEDAAVTERKKAEAEAERARVAETAAQKAQAAEAVATAAALEAQSDAEAAQQAAEDALQDATDAEEDLLTALVSTISLDGVILAGFSRFPDPSRCDEIVSKQLKSERFDPFGGLVLEVVTNWDNELDEPIDTYWISPSGRRILWQTREPGQNSDVPLILGWVWVVEDRSGNCLLGFDGSGAQ